MAEQQYIPRIGEIVRIVNPQPQTQTNIQLQGSPDRQLQDTSTQALQAAQQNVSRINEYVDQTLQAAAKTAAVKAQGSGQSLLAQELMGLGTAVIEGYKFHKTVVAEEARAKEEQRKAQLKQVAATYEMRLRDLVYGVQDRVRQSSFSEGVGSTRVQSRQLLEEARNAGLEPEELARLQTIVDTPLYEMEQQQTRILIDSQEKARQSQLEYLKNTVRAHVSAQLGALEHVRPEEVSSRVNDILLQLAQNTANLTPVERAEIIAPIMGVMANQLQGNGAAQQELLRRSGQIQEFFTEVEKLRQEGLDRTNPAAFSEKVSAIAYQIGVSGLADSVATEGDAVQASIDSLRRQQQLQELTQDPYSGLTSRDQTDVLNADVAQFVFNMIGGTGSGRALMELGLREGGNVAPAVRVAARLAQEFRNNGDTGLPAFNRINGQINNVRGDIEKLITSINPQARLGSRDFIEAYNDQLGNRQFRIREDIVPREATATRQELVPLIDQLNQLQSQRTDIIEYWMSFGVRIDNPRSRDLVDQINARSSAARQRANQAQTRQMSTMSGAGLVNPNAGVAAGYPATPSRNAFGRAQAGSVTVPTPSTPNVQMVITRDFDGSGRVGRGSALRTHGYMAIDFAPVGNVDAPALTFQGGEVLDAREIEGYGGTVLVKTPDGHVELHAHLRSFNVRRGQRIAPGTALGLIGGDQNRDPMAGRSSGRHHHFEVFRGEYNPGNRINPYEYLAQIQGNVVGNRGYGLPPTQYRESNQSSRVPLNGEYLGNGMYFINGQMTNLLTGETKPYIARTSEGGTGGVVPAQQVFNRTAPNRGVFASITKADYPRRNNPRHNYGYQALRDDVEFATATATAADQLGIPAQWLADIMAFESRHTFDPGITNSLGCIGMIQLCPENHWRPGRTDVPRDWTPERISRMSRRQYVERVVVPFLRGRQYETVEDVLAYIFGGPRLYNRTPQERARIGDGYTTMLEYMNRLGEGVGRRYQHSYIRSSASTAPVHQQYVAGCGTCSRQASLSGDIVAHLASPNGIG